MDIEAQLRETLRTPPGMSPSTAALLTRYLGHLDSATRSPRMSSAELIMHRRQRGIDPEPGQATLQLAAAIGSGDPVAAQAALASGADPHYPIGPAGEPALSMAVRACKHGADTDLIRVIGKHPGLDPNHTAFNDETALHEAAASLSPPLVEAVLSIKGVDPVVRNSHNQTPAELADSRALFEGQVRAPDSPVASVGRLLAHAERAALGGVTRSRPFRGRERD